MKNLHKVALSIMVGASAIAFSAFKERPTNIVSKTPFAVTATYYNISGAINSTNPANFKYVDPALHPTAGCDTDTSKECRVTWTTANAPTDGQTPAQAQGTTGSPTRVARTQTGLYNGD
jgi:hypothetical protein